jgi:hypothetical protein
MTVWGPIRRAFTHVLTQCIGPIRYGYSGGTVRFSVCIGFFGTVLGRYLTSSSTGFCHRPRFCIAYLILSAHSMHITEMFLILKTFYLFVTARESFVAPLPMALLVVVFGFLEPRGNRTAPRPRASNLPSLLRFSAFASLQPAMLVHRRTRFARPSSLRRQPKTSRAFLAHAEEARMRNP